MFRDIFRTGLIALVISMVIIALFDPRVVTVFGLDSGGKTVASGIISILDGWLLWVMLAVVALLPFLLALGLDGKGQSAAGWLVFFGFLLSLALVGGYLVLFVAWQVIRLFRLFLSWLFVT